MTEIILLTGHLGSGKTTTLKHMLKEYEDNDVAAIINEFAAIGVDGEMLDKEGRKIAELNNGCVCCSKSNDMVKLVDVLQKKYDAKTIFIETTGVASLKPVLEALAKTNLPITNIVTVMDAKQYSTSKGFGIVSTQQIQHSSTIIINKTDQVSKTAINKMKKEIKSLNNQTQIIATSHGKVSVNQLKTAKKYKPSKKQEGILTKLFPELYQDKATKHINKKAMNSIVVELNDYVEKNKFKNYLENLPKQIPRAKGYIKTSTGTYEFNYSNKAYTLEKKEEKQKTTIVLIGNIGIKEKLKQKYLINQTLQKPKKLVNWLNVKT